MFYTLWLNACESLFCKGENDTNHFCETCEWNRSGNCSHFPSDQGFAVFVLLNINKFEAIKFESNIYIFIIFLSDVCIYYLRRP